MVASEDQTRSIPREQVDDILLAFWQWLRVQEARWHDDPARKDFHFSPSIVAGEPMVDANPVRAAKRRRPLGRRVFRTLVLGFVVVAIAGTAVGWQSGDETTKTMVTSWVDALNGLLPALRSDSTQSPEAAAEAAKISDRAPMLEAALAQVAPAAQPAPPAALSPELRQRLETIGNDITAVQRLVAGLAAKQEQMTQDIATLQSSERSLTQRISSQAPAANAPPRKTKTMAATAHASPAPTAASRAQAPLPLH
jgi:hypothetical protein